LLIVQVDLSVWSALLLFPQTNIKRHYTLRHADKFANCPERQKVVKDLKAAFLNEVAEVT